jgi:hypothetical protein
VLFNNNLQKSTGFYIEKEPPSQGTLFSTCALRNLFEEMDGRTIICWAQGDNFLHLKLLLSTPDYAFGSNQYTTASGNPVPYYI